MLCFQCFLVVSPAFFLKKISFGFHCFSNCNKGKQKADEERLKYVELWKYRKLKNNKTAYDRFLF
jgi:hypothetical protein